MALPVEKNNHPIGMETRSLISKRYKTITKAVNKEFRNIDNDSDYSFYVGSYGRGTAIDTSDLDVLVELPNDEYEHFHSLSGNGASRLLQAVKNAVMTPYPKTNIKADGQVVVVQFSDDMRFEILPAFRKIIYGGNWDGTYIYPDTHMGGNWLTTNPKAEQKAMIEKNLYEKSNGLLFDTCKHIRYIHNQYYSSYHLSGILIDTFVYKYIGIWHWCRNDENNDNYCIKSNEFEKNLMLLYYSSLYSSSSLQAPGSNEPVDTRKDLDTLGKVLGKIVG